jgi:hypothetical protein
MKHGIDEASCALGQKYVSAMHYNAMLESLNDSMGILIEQAKQRMVIVLRCSKNYMVSR